MTQNGQELSELQFILCSEVLMCPKWHESCDLPLLLQTAVNGSVIGKLYYFTTMQSGDFAYSRSSGHVGVDSRRS